MDARLIGCFLETERSQGGSGGCSPHRLLLEPNVARVAAVDAHLIGCFYKPNVARVAAVDARLIGCFLEAGHGNPKYAFRRKIRVKPTIE